MISTPSPLHPPPPWLSGCSMFLLKKLTKERADQKLVLYNRRLSDFFLFFFLYSSQQNQNQNRRHYMNQKWRVFSLDLRRSILSTFISPITEILCAYKLNKASF